MLPPSKSLSPGLVPVLAHLSLPCPTQQGLEVSFQVSFQVSHLDSAPDEGKAAPG